MTQAERRQLIQEIASQVQNHYGNHVLALGVYGSVARGTDAPYSDIEMHCVLHGEAFEDVVEWSAGDWKAEIDIYTTDILLAEAATIEGDWPITHGAFIQVHPLYDPNNFFEQLKTTTLEQPAAAFKNAMEEVIYGELYERVGKLRDMQHTGQTGSLVYFAHSFGVFTACLHALSHRHLFTTASTLFNETLALPGAPAGFAPLAAMLMHGDLSDSKTTIQAVENCWTGIIGWAEEHNLQTEFSLAALLRKRPNPF